jgi:sugar lactone lactonase YvrE
VVCLAANCPVTGEGEIMVGSGRNHRLAIKPVTLTFLSALVVAFAAPALLFPAAAQAGQRVRPVVSLPAPELPESIAIDRRGDIYLSLNPLREILRIAPDGAQSVFATIPAGSQSLGVRLDAAGNVYVAVAGSGIWRIPAGGGTPAEFAPIPGLPNGLAFDHRGNLYVSESLGGAIYRITRHGSVSVWAQSPLLVGTTGPGPCGIVHPSGLPLGANGIAFGSRGDLLVANTTLGTIVRIRVRHDGRAGRPSVLAGPDCRLWGADGVAMDRRGNLYGAANAERDIVRVSPGGRLRVLASFAAGDPLYSPSDIAFGTRHGDRKQIFISNFARFTGGIGAGVVTMNAGIPGQPLP